MPTEEMREYALENQEYEPKLIGRLEYYGSNGNLGEIVEYSDSEKFIKDIKKESYYGVPFTAVLYRDKQGQTIPRDFFRDLDPPPSVLIEDAPVIDLDELEETLPENQEYEPKPKGRDSMPTEEEMKEYALESRMPPTNVLKGHMEELSSDYQNDPYKLEELLEFKSRLYNYSVNNTMLIRQYDPNATFVASPQTWQKLGYEVVQKEKAIPILYPVNPNTQDHTKFQRRSAFDITATNCPPEDYDLIRHTEHSPEQHPAMYQALREYIQEQGLAVEEAYLSPSVRGEYHAAKNRMILNNQMDDTQKLDTLLHQFGHYIMKTAAPNVPEAIREMEADAVSIMMSRQAGIEISDIRKQHFAASYQEAVSIPGFNLEKAMDTVNRVYRTWRVETDPLVQNALFEQQVSMEPEAPRQMEEVLEQQTEQENYRLLEQIAPEIVSGKSRSLRLERPGEEALLVERNGDRISIAQTYQKSHTDIANPNMDFVLLDGDRLSARNYQLDNAAGHYESAERGQDVDRNVLHRLNEMASKWLSHLEKTFPHTREVTREESPGNPSLRERFSDKMESIEKGIRHNWQERKRAQERERQARWEEKSLAEIQYLRDLDILQVARDMGFTPVQRKNHWTLREHDSVVFYDNNTFIRYSQEKGNGRKVGGSPIDFYAHFNNLLTGEAIREMKETYIRGRDLIGYRAREQPKKEKKEVPFVLPTPEKGPWRRMFAYLTKTRGIDSDVVQHCIDKNLLYEETKYHNTVFVGRDHTGQAVFASKRSSLPNSKFRMDVEGSNQENGWQVNHPGAKLLVLTEAPIDAMSAMCIRKHMGRPVESANYLASCGTGKAISVLRNYMKKHPEITAIRIGMDNDDAGRKAAQNLRTWLQDEYPDVKIGGFIALPEGRDLNDAWRGIKSQGKTPAAKPPARKRQNTVEVE